jgi:hypothetical protein
VDVSSIALRREAIITNVDPGTLDGQVLNVQGVKEIRVLGERSSVVGLGCADDILERNVLGYSDVSNEQ